MFTPWRYAYSFNTGSTILQYTIYIIYYIYSIYIYIYIYIYNKPVPTHPHAHTQTHAYTCTCITVYKCLFMCSTTYGSQLCGGQHYPPLSRR